MTDSLVAAGDADLAAVAALVNGAYRGAESRQGWTTEAEFLEGERTSEQRLRADLAADASARLLLLREEESALLLGCVWINREADDRWYIGMLTVRPDLQDRQIGRRLLAGAEAAAVQAGARRIGMTVISRRDTLIAWYQRRGYRLTGETRPFPYADPPRPDLNFVVLEKPIG